MSHTFKDEPQERYEYHDKADAKARDRERGEARKTKHACQLAVNTAPKAVRDGSR
jgi:hypothetical protein